MAAARWHVFVGSETGLLKGIHAEQNYWENLNTLETPDKDKEICVMYWGNKD
jgi:hypothetical protein